MRRLNVVFVLALVIASILPVATPAQAAETRPRYDIQAAFDYTNYTAEVVERVRYVNRTGARLATVAFDVVPTGYDAFRLLGAKVNGAPVRTILDGASLELVLPRPLAPGSAVDLQIDYQLPVPNQTNIRLGHHNGVVYLGNWYPTLQVFDQAKGDWPRYPYVEEGDAFYSEAADYAVTLDFVNAPANLTVAHSGRLVSKVGDHYVLSGERMREFAVTFSDLYLTSSKKVGATTILTYYLPNETAGAAYVLDTAAKAVEWGNEHLGPYPYPTLTIAEGIDPTGGGQEYSSMFILASGDYNGYKGSYFYYLVAHEIYHEWFYWLVGNDQVEYGWLDESFGCYLGYQFVKEVMGDQFDFATIWQANVIDYYDSGVKKWGYVPLDTIVYDYANDEHIFRVQYRQGAIFQEEVRSRLGDAAYYQMLREYISANRWGIASSTDLLERILYRLPVDGPGLIRSHFSQGTLEKLGL